jgi:hypothetical protein
MVSSTTKELITGIYEYFRGKKKKIENFPPGQIVNRAACGKGGRKKEAGGKEAWF